MYSFKLFVLIFLGSILGTFGEDSLTNSFSIGDFNFTIEDEPVPDIEAHLREKRALKNYIPAILSCALKYDVPCLITNGEDFLEEKRISALAEADASAAQMRGKDSGQSPSALASTIGNIISEMTSLVKEGFVGIFRDSKENDEEEDDDEEEGEVEQKEVEEKKSSRGVEEERGKKKKKKLKAIIKLLLLGIVLYAKTILLLKFLALKVQIKFLLIALGNLLINALKIWWEFKSKHSHNPQKVIYYEHAQHQHHYDGGGEDWESSGPPSGGGGYWGRSYDEKDQINAQEMAYAKQRPRPQEYVANDKNTGTWF